MFEGFEKFAQKCSELCEEDRPVYLFSVEVDSIEPQRDDIDPSRLKRGRAKIIVKERSKKSFVTAVVEFRGNTLILSRVNGNCDLREVGSRLTLSIPRNTQRRASKQTESLSAGEYFTTRFQTPPIFSTFST